MKRSVILHELGSDLIDGWRSVCWSGVLILSCGRQKAGKKSRLNYRVYDKEAHAQLSIPPLALKLLSKPYM